MVAQNGAMLIVESAFSKKRYGFRPLVLPLLMVSTNNLFLSLKKTAHFENMFFGMLDQQIEVFMH